MTTLNFKHEILQRNWRIISSKLESKPERRISDLPTKIKSDTTGLEWGIRNTVMGVDYLYPTKSKRDSDFKVLCKLFTGK